MTGRQRKLSSRFLTFIVIYMKKILMKQTSIPLHIKNFRVKILSMNKIIKYSLKE